jgi:autotransporter-associated beta strand protein
VGGKIGKFGTGTLILQAAPNYTGDTTIAAGTLQFGTAATSTGTFTLTSSFLYNSGTFYYNPATGSFKRGAGSSVKGAPRRLAALFNQLDLTWYLYGMSADEVLNLLPKEFDRFRATA